AMVIAVLLAIRSRRARRIARRALAQGRHGALLALADVVSADPEKLLVSVLAEAHRQGEVNEARLRTRLVRTALRQPPVPGTDPLSLAAQALPADQRIALGLRY